MKNDIRFLITDACNYDCYFCHKEGVNKSKQKNRLKVEDYITLYRMYYNMEDWNGVTISGGEPLLFSDIDLLLKRLYEEGANITMVTNGSLLHLHLSAIKYVKRLNVSIHTMNEEMYSQIIGRESKKLYMAKENLRNIRKLYPEIEIRLNVTPCKNQNWDIKELKSLISFAEEIGASIKCTELFPNNQENCISIETLEDELQEIGYTYVPTEGRTKCYEKDKEQIFLTQCTCSKAIIYDNPIEYCRENHDLYVNYDATFPLCRLGTENINFWEDINKNNFEKLKIKMEIAKRRVSKELCQKHLKDIFVKEFVR